MTHNTTWLNCPRPCSTVYPKKYAHGFCFAVLCFGYTLTDFPISIRLTLLALWQSNDCPSASKATLMNMDKYFMWVHYERLHNHNKAKHNKTVCIFIGIYCTPPSCTQPSGSVLHCRAVCSSVNLCRKSLEIFISYHFEAKVIFQNIRVQPYWSNTSTCVIISINVKSLQRQPLSLKSSGYPQLTDNDFQIPSRVVNLKLIWVDKYTVVSVIFHVVPLRIARYLKK